MDQHPLKTYRKANNLTQEELAKRLGVAGLTVYRWEAGARKIDDDLLPKVVEATGIAACDLRPDLVKLLGVAK